MRQLALTLVLGMVLLAMTAVLRLRAQTPTAQKPLTFEVASIKQHVVPGGGRMDLDRVNNGPTGTIFTTVQEQLGLKLESVKDRIEILVIDSVHRPTEN